MWQLNWRRRRWLLFLLSDDVADRLRVGKEITWRAAVLLLVIGATPLGSVSVCRGDGTRLSCLGVVQLISNLLLNWKRLLLRVLQVRRWSGVRDCVLWVRGLVHAGRREVGSGGRRSDRRPGSRGCRGGRRRRCDRGRRLEVLPVWGSRVNVKVADEDLRMPVVMIR